MKYRQGFVSNSSSSSFIVGFPKIPRTVKEMTEMLFDKDQEYHSAYDDKYPVEQIAKTILDDVNDLIPLVKEEFMVGIREGVDIDYFDPKFKSDDGFGTDYSKYEAACKARAEVVGGKTLEKYADWYFFELEYADEDGPYFSAIEHGDTFNKLPNFKTSHH